MATSATASALVKWLLATALLVLVNAVADLLPGRLDLTEEQRFTLTPATERIVDGIEDPLFVEVLLEGEFPASFRRLRDAAEELLLDLGALNAQVAYTFTDPNDGDAEEVNQNRRLLAEKGIQPVNFQVVDTDGRNQSVLYPYAIVTYRNRTALVNLLENNVPGQSPEVALNNSVSLLEYKLANAIQKLARGARPLVAFTTGHGELAPLQTRDLEQTLAPYYQVGRLRLDTMGGFGPEDVAVLLVAKPRRPFGEREKFLIDQYVMRGGSVVFMLDRLDVNLDSLQGRRDFIPRDLDLGLDDLLFKYGLRLEPNLVLDLQSTRVPVVVGQLGNAPQFDLRPWPYHVLANPNPDHPVTKALEPVNLFFPSEVDTTVRTRTPTTKTVLLASTGNAAVRFNPVRVDLESARGDPAPGAFDDGPYPLAVLAEGEFPSLYANRVDESFRAGLESVGQRFRESSDPGARVLLVGDGDVAKNAINPEQDAFRPLGLNPFERYVFDNKAFALNAIEYLTDDSGVIEARSREVKLRLLDVTRARAERLYWQALNVGAPLLLLLGAGLAYRYLRRRRYARPA